ncbi:Membrane protein insertase YidC [Candidatus Hepatincolaceae symbiont of Richtersius coronifer]
MFEGVFGKNFWIATAIAFIVILGWDYFFMKDVKKANQNSIVAPSNQTNTNPVLSLTPKEEKPQSREEILALSSRVTISNPMIEGSLSLQSGIIDDISLKYYKQTIDPNSANIRIFDIKNTDNAYFFESGWLSSSKIALPSSKTIWSTTATTLTPDSPVTLSWNNKQGLIFRKIISIDDLYVLTIVDEVENISGATLELAPFSLILRHQDPQVQDLFINHEGFVGYVANSLERIKYEDTLEKIYSFNTTGGYLGFTDKYWLSSILLEKNQKSEVRFLSFKDSGKINNYQVDNKGIIATLAPQSKLSTITHLFVGPKEYNVIKHYNQKFSLEKFDDTIDFGWFFFFTKPMIKFLLWIYNMVGNFGIAILIFTVIIRLIILPIAYKSYISMAKLKELQPKMKELKATYAQDLQKYNKELMGLYKKEKVNPLSGCLPVLLQIPIFFSIYKVIFISIEMRHAAFFGWVKDMSVADPSNIFTLFGLIPIDLPGFLHIGIWPILMGVTMYFQQKFATTQALDGLQQKIMNMMPVILVFVLASFPVGLVIYWTWSNVLSIIQQYIINKKVHRDLMMKNKKRKKV